MFFTVLPVGIRLPATTRSKAFLVTDNWDDWFKYNTLYSLHFVDDEGKRHTIGGVKIGQFDMEVDQRRPAIPKKSFIRLDDRFFSLGQDDSYYENMNKLGEDIRDQILAGLRDVASDLALFDRALDEIAFGLSVDLARDDSTVHIARVPPSTEARYWPKSVSMSGDDWIGVVDQGLMDDPEELSRWTLRIRGDGEMALRDWDRDKYWAGEFTVPLSDVLE